MFIRQSCSLLLPLVVVLVGCVPQTRFRRTAFVPSPGGEPFVEPLTSDAEVGGTISYTDVSTDSAPVIGDPAMERAELSAHAHGRLHFADWLSGGVELAYAHRSMSQITAAGTPPTDEDHLYGLGTSLTFGWSGPRAGLALTVAGTLYSVPWTSWERVSPVLVANRDFDPTQHRIADGGRVLLLMPRLTLAGSHRFLPELTGFVGLSAQATPVNVGFDDEPRVGSTLSVSDWGVVPLVGVTTELDGGLYLSFQYFLPLGFEQQEYGDVLSTGSLGGAALTVGFRPPIASDPAPYQLD